MSNDTPKKNDLVLDVKVGRWRITQKTSGPAQGFRYDEPWPATYPGGGEVNNCELAMAWEIAHLRAALQFVADVAKPKVLGERPNLCYWRASEEDRAKIRIRRTDEETSPEPLEDYCLAQIQRGEAG